MLKENEEKIAVSVYCLAYNHEKYIRRTLDGFVKQKTDFEYEVLVHEDASMDRTAEIIREYAGKYPDIIKPIYQKENQFFKVDIVETYIYPRVRGKYIAICEGDDYWTDENKLQKQYDILEQHPECSLCTHKVQCCDEDGTLNGRVIPDKGYQLCGSRVLKEEEIVQCYWLRQEGYPFHTSSYFFRREIIRSDLYSSMDAEILRSCLTLGLVYYIDEIMSVRRFGAAESWNERLERGGIKAFVDTIDRDIEYDREYDQYTAYRYHNAIEVRQLRRILGLADRDVREARKLLQKYRVDWKGIRYALPLGERLNLCGRTFLVHRMPAFFKLFLKLYSLYTGGNKG